MNPPNITRDEQEQYYQKGYPAPISYASEDASYTEIVVIIHDILSVVERGGMDTVEDFVETLEGPFYVTYNGSHHAWDFTLAYFTEGLVNSESEDSQKFVPDSVLRLLYNKGRVEDFNIQVSASDRYTDRYIAEGKQIDIDNVYEFIDENLDKALKAWESSRDNY